MVFVHQFLTHSLATVVKIQVDGFPLKMEAARSSETLVSYGNTTWTYVLEDVAFEGWR